MDIYQPLIETILAIELFILILFLSRNIKSSDNLAESLADKQKMYDFCIHQLDLFKKKLDEMQEKLNKF